MLRWWRSWWRSCSVPLFLQVPWMMASSAASGLWQHPSVIGLESETKANKTLLHQCQFGSVCKKATVVMHHGMEGVDKLARRCRPVGPDRLCSRTMRDHVILSGKSTDVHLATRVAEYPPELCKAFANTLEETAFCVEFCRRAASIR